MERYKLTSTVKCTCNFHYFIPQTTTKIAMKRINFDENYAQVFDFHHTRYSQHTSLTSVKQGSYAEAVHDRSWYIGHVVEGDQENGDVQVNFLHPEGPAVSYHYPKYPDICWIPYKDILCSIDVPMLATLRGQYTLAGNTVSKIVSCFNRFYVQNLSFLLLRPSCVSFWTI